MKQNLINMGSMVLDKQAKGSRQNKIALYWQSEEGKQQNFTFKELYLLSNQFGNLLKKAGIKKGERVFFFLPRVPLVYYGFIGALKIGAIPGTLFAAFAPQALEERLKNSGAKILVTNKELYSRVKKVEKNLPELKKVLLAENIEKLLTKASAELEPARMKPKDPAFMLYTSATGNTPVCGIVIPHQAFPQELATAKLVLNLKENDIYWCTADPGWVTGVVYGILTPWACGAAQIIYEGRFDAKKWYSLIEDFKVNIWYTAPTAIKMLKQAGEPLIKNFNLSSLKYIYSVGEALNPALIDWSLKYWKKPIYETYWQTETGAMMITTRPGQKIKPGSMGKPLPGIKAAIVDDKGKTLSLNKAGNLAFKPGWPSMMVDVWRNKKRYGHYFQNGWYLTGDKAYRDKDGYFWFVGRDIDMIKTSGERVGAFEVESSIMEYPGVLEAGVIGKPDPLRGEIIKAFVVLKSTLKPSEALKLKLQEYVKKNLAGHAYPREVEFVQSLPKNRSGKVVRRILKAKELGLPLGDTSTLED